jgi:aminoglycoside phosphotransferase (APT) family kinase protein
MPTRFAPKPQAGSPSHASIDAALLAYLRLASGDHALSFAEAPTQLSGGFDTTIFAFGLESASERHSGPMIVRIFRPDSSPAQAQFESGVQNAVHSLGFPTPPVLFTCMDASILGSAFLVMPRAPGRIMLDGMLGPGMLTQFRVLGALHARLHDLNVDAFQSRIAAEGATDWTQVWATTEWLEQRVAAGSLTGLAAGVEWLRKHEPAPTTERSVCHGDFHPINILTSGRDVTGVIDWSLARVEDPAWDVGATVALMSQGPVDLPAFLYGLLGRVRGWLVGRYLKSYAATRPLDLRRVRYYEAARYLGFLIEAAEYIQAPASAVAPKPTAFGDAHVQQGIIRRFRQITGVRLTLP